MFAPRGDEGQPTVDRCGQGGGGSTTCGCPHWKKKDLHFFYYDYYLEKLCPL